MRVSAQYAKEHFEELLPAKDGDEIDIEREGDGTVRLRLVTKADVPARNRIWGIAKGQIWMSEDFDAPEVNKDIEDSFYESDLE